MSVETKIQDLRDQASFWESVKDAIEQEKSPLRDRMVVLVNGEYVATYRWEINPDNGWVTVQLNDGSILPTRPGHWSLWSYAQDFFGISRSDIQVDDPDKGL